MDLGQAQRLLLTIPTDARVVDVGGGASPFPRADHVIDALPFDESGNGSGGNIHQTLQTTPRFTRDTWTQWDLCDRRPWPFADKTFDFAVCSHVLEDLRDPVWVCSELSRIAKAGYIEVPSRVEEQSRGVENPCYAGYCHHRWLISKTGNQLVFRHKPHLLHSISDAIVTDLSPGQRIHPRHAIVSLDWRGSIDATEVFEFDEQAIVDDLRQFAADARRLPDLKTSARLPLARRIKRHIHYHNLARGRR